MLTVLKVTFFQTLYNIPWFVRDMIKIWSRGGGNIEIYISSDDCLEKSRNNLIPEKPHKDLQQ